jgi:putative PIN family toxin of toxin-antitoxin system
LTRVCWFRPSSSVGCQPGRSKRHLAHTPSLSQALLQEYRDVPSDLLRKQKITDIQFRSLIAGIAAVVTRAKMLTPRKRLAICRDPKDDMLLECCLAAHAEILLTSDRDLLELRGLPFQLTTLSPRQFMGFAILDKSSKKRS